MVKKLFIFIVVSFLCVAGGAYQPVKAEKWVEEEILEQLSELRRDYNTLQKEVDQLKSIIARSQEGGDTDNPSAAIELGDDPYLGSLDAKVVIVEFTDYQCPYCRRHSTNTLPKIKNRYIDKGDVLYVLKDYPLGFHDQAQSAAIAANCAGKQGKYWEMHDELFSPAISLGQGTYEALAIKLSLQEEEFKSCMADPQQVVEVEGDFNYGSSVGVQGTPAFYIGKLEDGRVIDGSLLSGALPFNSFSKAIERLRGE